ncbi:MFS transporter [Nocardia sp. GAS34]|uniref:MFS transporter n=1 Tax=unclassified Nocardia TaxID=2637762 RepID=UPI003D19AB6C
MVLLIGLGSFFNLFEVALGSFFGVLLQHQWSLSTTQLGLVAGSVFIGEMFGSSLLAPLADRLGRRRMFQLNLLVYCGFSLATALSPNLAVFLVLRVLAGVGLGAQLTLVDTYLSELLPARSRGRSIAWSYTFGMLAVPIAGVLAKFAHGTIAGLDGWRWLLIMTALGGLAVWQARRHLPESPRWLAAIGRASEAERTLREIELHVTADRPLPAPPEVVLTAAEAAAAPLSPATYRLRAILVWVMQTLGPIGFYGFATIAPLVLLAKGYDVAHSLTYSALSAIGYPLGSLVSVYLTERFERRALLIASSLVFAASGLAFGFASTSALVLVAGFATTLSSVVQSNVTHIYQAELFESANRSTSIGIPYSASRLIAGVLPLAALTLMSAIGPGGLYSAFAVLLVVMTITVRILGPRTNNASLDTI